MSSSEGMPTAVPWARRRMFGQVAKRRSSVGFWAAAFSSLIGVWNGVSLMFADFVGKPVRLAALASAIDRLYQGEEGGEMPDVPGDSGSAPEAANPILEADLALLGGPRIRQLIGLFASQGAALVAELASSEGEARRALAHKLKGSALALGLDTFAAQCAAVEEGGGADVLEARQARHLPPA